MKLGKAPENMTHEEAIKALKSSVAENYRLRSLIKLGVDDAYDFLLYEIKRENSALKIENKNFRRDMARHKDHKASIKNLKKSVKYLIDKYSKKQKAIPRLGVPVEKVIEELKRIKDAEC